MASQHCKHVLYLRTDLGTQDLIGGGSVAHTLGVLKGFSSLGISVFCASTAMHSIIKQLHIPFLPLSASRIMRMCGFKISCVLSNVTFYFKLKRVIDQKQITMIYQRYSMLNCVGVALAQCFGIPLYLEFNGSESWVDKHWSTKRRLKISWLIEHIELLNLKHATNIIVVSQVLKEQLLARGIDAGKILVCPNGVDVEMFNPLTLQPDRERLRAASAMQATFVFGFSGTFGPWHGADVLAYMIPKVVQKNPHAHFLLIGDGPHKQMLYDALAQAQVLPYVTFTGMLPADDVPAYLAMCDAFLCPTQPNADGSRFFGSPTKLFEYMAMAKPIIASDIEQLSEVLKDDAQHLLVQPHDYAGFVDAALRCMDMSADDRDALGSKLQQCVQKKYTWQAHVRSFCE